MGRPAPRLPGRCRAAQRLARRAPGLAEDVRRYGQWMRDEAEKRIGHLYPKVKRRWRGGACHRLDLGAHGHAAPTRPAAARCRWSAPGGSARRRARSATSSRIPTANESASRSAVRTAFPVEGTVRRTGAVCLLCGTPVPLAYIRAEGKAGRMGAQLMAIAAEGKRQRLLRRSHRGPREGSRRPLPGRHSGEELSIYPGRLNTVIYGLTRFADLFTNRQLTVLVTFSDLIKEAHSRIAADSGSTDYANSVAMYLAFALSKLADRGSSICSWVIQRESR